MDRRVWYVLIGVHVVLGLWAGAGLAEWFSVPLPWPSITNPLFPKYVLFLQWVLSLAASALFLAGYVQRWSRTPSAMAVVYAAMALVCAVETFIYMQGVARFIAMAAEYVAYVSILVILFRSKRFRAPEAVVMLPSS